MLSNTELRAMKSRLTKAKNSGNPYRVITEVENALEIFKSSGYPDCWQDWNRALYDAEFQISRFGA